VRGGGFELGGRAIEPHGINSYPLLQLLGRGRLDAVRDIFGQAHALGRPFVRTNAFLDGGENPARLREADGAIREPGLAMLDLLLAEAGRSGVRLLLVLTNNWPDHGGAEAVLRAVAPGEALPKDAFWSDPRALAAQRALIRAVVGRTNGSTGVPYAEDPAVFAWELANEARCTEPRYCRRDTLVTWAREMAAAVRGAGALQPVAWGGSGYAGRFGEDLAAIAADGAVDVLTLHVYPRLLAGLADALDARARIGWAQLIGAMRLYQGARVARRHRLPLIVEELGYLPPVHAEDRDAERAAVLSGLLATAHELGACVFPWMIGEPDRPDHDGHLIRPDDRATWRAIRRN
jgi:mannan endo-1,4-beta-mannosidase